MRFDFDGKIEKEVLENYLSRCATAAGLYQSETLSDDLRVIKKLGIKFLGRASGIWYMTENDEEHFERSRKLAERVHELDPEIILQACVFEMITQGIEADGNSAVCAARIWTEGRKAMFQAAGYTFCGSTGGLYS